MDFFDVFQLISLLLFLLIFIGRSLWLQWNGTKIFVVGNGKGQKKAALEMVFIAILMLWVYEIIRCSLGFSYSLLPAILIQAFTELKLLKTMGAVLITAGLIVFILALVAFKTSWRIGIDTQNPGELVTSGIFSFTRNPVFVFINLYFTGTALIYTNWFFSVLAIMALFGIHFHILNEEKFLSTQYGETYSAYKKRVRRYF